MVIASEILAWTALCGCALSFLISLTCISSVSKMLKLLHKDSFKTVPIVKETFNIDDEKTNLQKQSEIHSPDEMRTIAELKLRNFIRNTQSAVNT